MNFIKIILTFSFTILSQIGFAQKVDFKKAQMMLLNKSLEETSGLCLTKEGLWSINDSHNPSEIHLLSRENIDSQIVKNGNFFWGGQSELKSSVFPISEKNIDWEAIETDGKHLFIGDFGNNAGARKDLRIIEIEFDSTLKKFEVRHIYNFKYEDQTNFEKRKLHNFDCEAFRITDSSFQLFTKNWANLRCNIYEFPRIQLTDSVQVAHKISSFNPKFLITDVSIFNGHLFFCGYSPSGNQYIAQLNDKSFKNFKRTELPYKPAQFEAIQVTPDGVFLSTESRKSMPAMVVFGRWSEVGSL